MHFCDSSVRLLVDVSSLSSHEVELGDEVAVHKHWSRHNGVTTMHLNSCIVVFIMHTFALNKWNVLNSKTSAILHAVDELPEDNIRAVLHHLESVC